MTRSLALACILPVAACADPLSSLGGVSVFAEVYNGELRVDFGFMEPPEEDCEGGEVSIGVDDLVVGPAYANEYSSGDVNFYFWSIDGDPHTSCRSTSLAVPVEELSESPVVWIGTEHHRYEMVVTHGVADRDIVGVEDPVLLEGNSWVDLQLVHDGDVPLKEEVDFEYAALSIGGTDPLYDNADIDYEATGPGTMRARVIPGTEDEYVGDCGESCKGELEVKMVTMAEVECDGFDLCALTVETEDSVPVRWLPL